ncbi:unnamed protein product [Brachionus calyciflorus]|uniref:Nucleolar protein 6 n=1 Tax=Brachionus calyciflorus TaxID=104777 RepID=A0A813M1C5_9BILA|nr:unnamed protein product [Brachionus calyciflorus]
MIVEEEQQIIEDFDQVESGSKRFKHDPEFYKAPTAEEMYTLKNTENLYHSNLLRLQLDELLSEIKVSEDKGRVYNALINDLIKSLKSMKPVKDVKYSDLKLFEAKNLTVPLGDLCKKVMKEGSYTFEAPKNVNLIGSFLSQTQLKTSENVSADICLEISDSFFTERDYLNYRYFIKRNLYMAHTYLHLMNSKRYSKLKYEFQSDFSSQFKPTLSMLFEGEGLEVRLHFSPSGSAFKLSRFNPGQCNARREFFTKNINSSIKFQEGSEEIYDPTPNYNFDVLSDLTIGQNNQVIKDKLGNSKSLLEAVKLIKLWLLKRELNNGFGGFDNFTLNMLIVYLLNNRQINPLMSPYQIFRLVLINLSDANWDKKGISLRDFIKNDSETSNETKSLCKIEDFHKYYQVVFLDSTGFMNITSKMSLETFQKVKFDAKISLNLLNDESIDNFDKLFIQNHSFLYECDALVKIGSNSKCSFYYDIIKTTEKVENLVKLIDSYDNSYTAALEIIMNVLKKALNERTNLIFVELVKKIKWNLSSKPSEDLPSVAIGLFFNDKYDNALIKGPSSTSPEAIEFRRFWGAKSELRRFQDTSICEAVYFEAKDLATKRLVYSEIVKHILNYHLSISEENLKFCDRQMNSLLSLPNGIIENYGTGEEKIADVVNTFDEFSRIIKNLKDLPLLINSINGISSVFRLTDTFAPLPGCFNYDSKSEKNMRFKIDHKYVPKYPLGPVIVPYVKPLEILIQLESSGKWPDDVECIKRLKTAFYLKIVQLLRENHDLVSYTHVEYLDVLYKGFVFRLFVYTMHELLCMKTSINELGIRVTNDTKESLAYEKILLHSSQFNSVIHGLQQKFNCFSGVCRLAKRWLSSQFLLEYFEDEAVDLLCASLFVNSFEPPRSIITGFIQFLNLIANYDWKNQLLLVNFNNELKKQQILDMQLKFQENRSQLQPVFILTPYDSRDKGSIWTIEKPNIQQFCRTVILAKQSLPKIKNSILNFESTDSFKNIFRPNIEIYDVIINLKPSYCVKAYQKVDICKGTFLPHYRAYDANDSDKTLPVVGFDPVEFYVKELREAFDDIALFFYDLYGSTKIHVLWKPDALKSKELKINNVKYRLIDRNTNELVLNLEAILEDFKIIGNELVESIKIKNESSVFK